MNAPTLEQIDNLCEHLVEDMTMQQLKQYVYDDLHHLVSCDSEMFWMNLEQLDMKPEDFNNLEKELDNQNS